jgi:hypothetical protein
MANPRGRKHCFNAKGPERGRKQRKPRPPRKARQTKKAASADKKEAPEGVEAVRHYGEAWDFEHYEKESLKAQGLYL